jgi:pSer/pThr/pTyr-binding forkhead associated (FHA) protein
MPEILVKFGSEVVDTVALAQETIRIGRSKDNDIVLDHLSVSRHHAEVRREDDNWVIADLESANGTYVNGQRITTVPLYHADTITVGKHHMHFFDTPVEQATVLINDFADERTMVLDADGDEIGIPKACLTVTKGKQRGKEFVLKGERTLIGRANDCDIQLNDWLVSKHHAQIICEDGEHIVEDLGSWRAIHVNGLPTKRTTLRDGDALQIGGTRLSFRDMPSTGDAALASPSDEGISTAADLSEPEGADRAAAGEPASQGKKPMVVTPLSDIWEDFLGAADELESPPEETGAPQEESPGVALDSAWDADPVSSVESLDAETGPSAGEEGGLCPEEFEPAPLPTERSREFAVSEVASAEADWSDGQEHAARLEELEPAQPPAAESQEFTMWMNAYTTGGPAVRRHAARQLERITGEKHEC